MKMKRILIFISIAILGISCGTELDNPIYEIPENGNYTYTSTVKYYSKPGGSVEHEQSFNGYITFQGNETGGTASIDIQPEYGSSWNLKAEDLNVLNGDSTLYKLFEQNISIADESFSVIGMQVYNDNGEIYHVLRTADSLIIKYNSLLIGSGDYKYTEGEIRGARFR